LKHEAREEHEAHEEGLTAGGGSAAAPAEPAWVDARDRLTRPLMIAWACQPTTDVHPDRPSGLADGAQHEVSFVRIVSFPFFVS
jgi:hypothetical protein